MKAIHLVILGGLVYVAYKMGLGETAKALYITYIKPGQRVGQTGKTPTERYLVPECTKVTESEFKTMYNQARNKHFSLAASMGSKGGMFQSYEQWKASMLDTGKWMVVPDYVPMESPIQQEASLQGFAGCDWGVPHGQRVIDGVLPNGTIMTSNEDVLPASPVYQNNQPVLPSTPRGLYFRI